MKVKVIKFIVTPIYVLTDDDGLVATEGEGKSFAFYPGSPFDILKTVIDAETIISKHLGIAEQAALFNEIKTTELTTQ